MLYRRQEDILAMSMDATIVALNPIVGKSREKLKAQEENVLMRVVAESAGHRTILTKT